MTAAAQGGLNIPEAAEAAGPALPELGSEDASRLERAIQDILSKAIESRFPSARADAGDLGLGGVGVGEMWRENFKAAGIDCWARLSMHVGEAPSEDGKDMMRVACWGFAAAQDVHLELARSWSFELRFSRGARPCGMARSLWGHGVAPALRGLFDSSGFVACFDHAVLDGAVGAGGKRSKRSAL